MELGHSEPYKRSGSIGRGRGWGERAGVSFRGAEFAVRRHSGSIRRKRIIAGMKIWGAIHRRVVVGAVKSDGDRLGGGQEVAMPSEPRRRKQRAISNESESATATALPPTGVL